MLKARTSCNREAPSVWDTPAERLSGCFNLWFQGGEMSNFASITFCVQGLSKVRSPDLFYTLKY